MSYFTDLLRAGHSDARITNAYCREAAARIEQLEAALRLFADDENWRFGRRLDPNGSRFDGTSTARAALAPEQDK